MRFTNISVKLLGIAIACVLPTCQAAPTCPLEGPVFPKPLRLASSEAMKVAISNLTETFKGITGGAQNYSFALQVFSAHDPDPVFSVLHTAPKLATLNTTGVKKVDEDTVFRVGSLTKIYSIYLFLINAGDKVWNEPITNYVPELRELINGSDPVVNTDWERVTIGGLATQMTGVPRDYNVVQYGFPPLSAQEQPPCGDYPLCSRKQFFTGLSTFYPYIMRCHRINETHSSGYALETITGKTYETLLEETILKPLGLNNTFLRAPERSRGLIPGHPDVTGWTFDLGEAAGAGNIYTSIEDLSKIGRAILSYELLDPVITRRWLKPFSFSTDPHASVGAPWGARRINVAGQPYRWITAFNKAGRISDYSSVLAIIPDYDIGISVLLAGELPPNANFNLLDIIGEVLIPAVEQAARAEADAAFSGRYAFANTGQRNSSMTIKTDAEPGLSVSQWISNGTDFLWTSTVLQNGYLPLVPRVRLYPTGLESQTANGTTKVVFKAVFEDANQPSQAKAMFSTDCATWINVASVIYGSAAMDELIFEVDSKGKAISITSPSLRVTLDKK
ncbi:beta-lactamase/transpeptidase-like protein [Xylaria bambusicola]|uniref:beta-lactamase/transpeptidase-like protein n=1 Tax=Xylaria bambusicola TaxID=326684 RepID=UPI002008DCFF|nr:beta-lactamase/transpeptidase-like protein [Xylaria bambusicola]KAI0508697.1 beta-lactamase/transpeptidase-like protein [Xylaria bambusicola]